MHAAFHFGQWAAKSEEAQIPNKTLEQNNLSKNLYVSLSHARNHSQNKNFWEWLLVNESRIYKLNHEKVVICHPLSHNLEM